jgi:hypothetical protein
VGLWTKFGGYAMMVGGVAAAPYTGGASLALVPAGARMVQSDQEQQGVKEAQGAQDAMMTKGIHTQVDARDAMNAAYAPYTSLGAGAASALGAGLGIPVATLGAPAGSGTGAARAAPLNPAGSPGSRQPSADAEMTGQQAVPRDAANTPTVQARAGYQTQSGYAPTLGAAAGPMVRMRAPTGQTKLVPQEQVALYQQRGAQVVQ